MLSYCVIRLLITDSLTHCSAFCILLKKSARVVYAFLAEGFLGRQHPGDFNHDKNYMQCLLKLLFCYFPLYFLPFNTLHIFQIIIQFFDFVVKLFQHILRFSFLSWILCFLRPFLEHIKTTFFPASLFLDFLFCPSTFSISTTGGVSSSGIGIAGDIADGITDGGRSIMGGPTILCGCTGRLSRFGMLNFCTLRFFHQLSLSLLPLFSVCFFDCYFVY